tara:strand:- start:1600 stop:1737 length:138 start_codon:yes stop_codon:yes gene_type:complete
MTNNERERKDRTVEKKKESKSLLFYLLQSPSAQTLQIAASCFLGA